MRTSKLNDYKKMTVEDLEKELKELKQELFKLRFSHAMNGLDNPQKMVEAKKNIARVNTILTMKKAGKEIKIKESKRTVKKVAKKETKKTAEKVEEKKETATKKTAEKAEKPATKKVEEKKETKKTGGKN